MGTKGPRKRPQFGLENPDVAGGARTSEPDSLKQRRANTTLRLDIPEFESLRLVSPAHNDVTEQPGNHANGALLPLISRPSYEHLRRSLTVRFATEKKQNPLLATFSNRGRREFKRLKADFSFKAGETFEMDDPDRSGLYFIESGKVEIEHTWPERLPRMRDTRTSGEYFGEYAVLDGARRQTVTVIADAEGSWIPANRFGLLVEAEPSLLLNLTRMVLRRQSERDDKLIEELTRARTESEKTLEQLQAVTATSEAINSALDLDQLLNVILEEAQRLTHADHATFYLVDHDAAQLYSYVSENGNRLRIALPFGKGFAGMAAESGTVFNIEDAYDDPRFNPDVDMQTGYRTRSVLTLPIRNPKDEIVGVIQLLNKAGNSSFTKEDEELITTLGVHAAIAIERTRTAESMTRTHSLAAVGNFAASIIHDLKSPMTVIQGYVDLLTYAVAAKDQKEHLEHISSALTRMVGMTQEVLDFSHGHIRLNPGLIKMNSYLAGLCDSVRHEMNRNNISLYLSCDFDDDWTAILDTDRFARVFHNLIANAKEAMPDGGNITVTLSHDKQSWELRVQDTGTGIEPGRLSAIFEPFSTHGKQRGTGLGLTITKNIVEEHGGTIRAESEVGKGTTFVVTMPYRPKMSTAPLIPAIAINTLNGLRALADDASSENGPASMN